MALIDYDLPRGVRRSAPRAPCTAPHWHQSHHHPHLLRAGPAPARSRAAGSRSPPPLPPAPLCLLPTAPCALPPSCRHPSARSSPWASKQVAAGFLSFFAAESSLGAWERPSAFPQPWHAVPRRNRNGKVQSKVSANRLFRG